MALSLTVPPVADKPKVLIVDDQPRNLDVLEAMLGGTDCALVRASSADEALLCLVRDEFAALVLDIRMPGMNGIELATLIKQRKRSQNVPILFLTAHSVDEDDVLRGYGAGAVDYLSKPVNAEILRSKVGVFVDAFRKARALADLNVALQREIAQREEAQAALQFANQELEHRVQERTNELTRAHREVVRTKSGCAWRWMAHRGLGMGSPVDRCAGRLTRSGCSAFGRFVRPGPADHPCHSSRSVACGGGHQRGARSGI